MYVFRNRVRKCLPIKERIQCFMPPIGSHNNNVRYFADRTVNSQNDLSNGLLHFIKVCYSLLHHINELKKVWVCQ